MIILYHRDFQNKEFPISTIRVRAMHLTVGMTLSLTIRLMLLAISGSHHCGDLDQNDLRFSWQMKGSHLPFASASPGSVRRSTFEVAQTNIKLHWPSMGYLSTAYRNSQGMRPVNTTSCENAYAAYKLCI